MGDSLQYGALATGLAAVQQRLALLEGGLAPYAAKAADPRHSGSAFGLHTPNQPQNSRPTLIGASKTQPTDVLEAAIKLGLRDFGENKVQEAEAKWPTLKQAYPAIRLHLIGPLQTNKVRDAVTLFDVIHSVDRPKLADALALEMKRQQKTPLLLIQVNTGEETQKAGVIPSEFSTLLAHCQAVGLSIAGLMCVPPENQNPAPHFALLQKMAATHGLRELSMGMSNDFEIAVRLGATMVRVGTALFGHRSA